MQFKSLTCVSFLLLSFVFCLCLADERDSQAYITLYENERGVDNYKYTYETSNGISQTQEGRVAEGADSEQGGINVDGTAEWTSPEGKRFLIQYNADQYGYRPRFKQLS